MTDWAMVQWSRARQITQAMGIKEKDTKTPAPGVSPADYFSNLVAVNALQDAVGFLAHALPRYEAIVWGAKALSALYPASDPILTRRAPSIWRTNGSTIPVKPCAARPRR